MRPFFWAILALMQIFCMHRSRPEANNDRGRSELVVGTTPEAIIQELHMNGLSFIFRFRGEAS